MANVLVLFTVLFVCTLINAQEISANKKPVIGQAFDEIVVSSDLNVRRKSKETRQGKKLLTNVPSATTNIPDKSTALAFKQIHEGRTVRVDNRKRRDLAAETAKRIFGPETAKFIARFRRH